MTALAGRTTTLRGEELRLAETFVRWLETGERPVDLYADGLFVDLSLPQWRLQGEGHDAAFELREDSHPTQGAVSVGILEATPTGFVMTFEERWEAGGQRWYCREMMHCVVTAERISRLHIYCTGDWDEATQRRHAEQVRLLRP